MIWVFDIHLSTYENLFFGRGCFSVSMFFRYKNVRRVRMAPSCVVVARQLASQSGVEWAMWMCGVLVGFSLVVPSFASMSTISFPVIPECARTLCMWTLCEVQCICRTIAAISSLSRWWC